MNWMGSSSLLVSDPRRPTVTLVTPLSHYFHTTVTHFPLLFSTRKVFILYFGCCCNMLFPNFLDRRRHQSGVGDEKGLPLHCHRQHWHRAAHRWGHRDGYFLFITYMYNNLSF
jgi:hypothetical protein